MALNKNHEFEELNGIKCGIVEKNVSPERVEFLKKILEFNGFEVVVAPTPPPKAAAAAGQPAVGQPAVVQPAVGQPAAGQSAVGQPAVVSQQSLVDQPANNNQQPTTSNQQPTTSNQQLTTTNQQPATFTLGVTDSTFNPINAIFGRQLKTPGNKIVTLAYWQQKEAESNDEIPYFDQKLD